jgi:outer membrane protein insertion porin family
MNVIVKNILNWRVLRKKIKALHLVLLAAIPLFLVLTIHITSYASGNEGKVIEALEMEGLDHVNREEISNLIGIDVGDHLDIEVLRSGVRRAFRTGVFLDIIAVSEERDGMIKLKFVFKEIPLVKKISIKGNKRVSRRKIKKAFLYKKRDNFFEDLVDEAKDQLKDFYSKKGYPDAQVEIDVEKSDDRKEVVLHIHIEEGKPLIIESINIPPEFRSRLRVSPGDVYDVERVGEDIERLKQYLKKQRFIRPVVEAPEFHEGKLTIPVHHGPLLEIVFKGNKAFSSKLLLGKVSIYDDMEVSDSVIRESIEKMKMLYYQKGYDHITVTNSVDHYEDTIRVVFHINEGNKVELKEIVFEAISITPEKLKKIIPLKEGKAFDRGLVEIAKESIRAFYNALGYIYATVVETRSEYIDDGRELTLFFVVDEGRQVTIQHIDVSGNSAVGSNTVRDLLHIGQGAPYNVKDIGDIRHRIVSYYNRLGYINAEVEVERRIESERAFITFKISENDPFVFGKIIVSGNRKTKDKIIRRELEMKEGESFNPEAIYRSRQRLYKLGLFDSVSIIPLETSDIHKHAKKTITTHDQDIIVELREGNPGAVEVSVGYGDYEHLRGGLDVSYINVGGYNRQVGLRTELSSVKQKYMLNFTEPWLFNKPILPLNISLIKEKTETIDIDTRDVRYKVDRLAFIASVDKEFTSRFKGNIKYEYSLVETTDVEPGIIISKEDTGTVGISSISPSLFYDTRDNPFDPVSGSIKGIELKIASRVILSEAEFIKVALQNSWYRELRKGVIFAFSTRGGIAQGIGDTVELPLVERFFLGGRNTVRGYDHDELGPKGENDTPTGGNVFVQLNGELRIALGKGFGLVTFLDAGNVWQTLGDVEAILRFTSGLGLRYTTPVGPVRIDYGHKLNRKDGESAGELHFSIGHAF